MSISAAPGSVNHKGQTALMLAAREGMFHLVQQLLHCHMSIMTIDSEGKTVLHYALQAKINQLPIVSCLLNIPKGYKLESMDMECSDLLFLLVIGIKSNEVRMDLLLSTFYGGSISEEIKNGCDSSVVELLNSLLKFTVVSNRIVFVEEDDLSFVCSSQS